MPRYILVLLLAALPLAGRAEPNFQALQGLITSLVKVEALNPDGSVSLGTAVVVAPGMVVTNCHVTRRARAIELVKGDHFDVESQYSDVEHDLCLLRAPLLSDLPLARLREEPLRVGEEVYAIGYILGASPRFNRGQVNALYEYYGGKVIQSSAPFSSGASGGGLFDERGQLVGIITFMHRGSSSYFFSLPAKWVSDALVRYRGQPVRPLQGTAFWQRPRDAQPFFLRAASLEAESNWWAVAELASQWSKTEPDNPSAWFTSGQAHLRLRQHEQAIAAFRKAVALDAGYAEAWYELGLAYTGNRDAERVARVHRVLQGLDVRLAHDLARATRECAESQSQPC